MNKIALITGATSGIGKATAKLLAKNNFDVIITGRRAELLKKTEEEIKNETDREVLSLCFDVRKNAEVIHAIDSLPEKWTNIDLLVNNAGLAAGMSRIHEGNLVNWERMIDTNLKGLLYVTRRITPGMVSRKSGHIINIGSIAGKEVYETGNVYCGTKYAVDALTQGMRIDLVDFNIRVTSINPGKVDTNFSLVRFNGDKERADKVYEGFTPLFDNDIAEAVLFAVSRPSNVNISDMTILPSAQANANKIIRN